jgi:hypothetical protein
LIWFVKLLMATAGLSVAFSMLAVTVMLVAVGPDSVHLAFHWLVHLVQGVIAFLICWRFLDRGAASEAAG